MWGLALYVLRGIVHLYMAAKNSLDCFVLSRCACLDIHYLCVWVCMCISSGFILLDLMPDPGLTPLAWASELSMACQSKVALCSPYLEPISLEQVVHTGPLPPEEQWLIPVYTYGWTWKQMHQLCTYIPEVFITPHTGMAVCRVLFFCPFLPACVNKTTQKLLQSSSTNFTGCVTWSWSQADWILEVLE